MWVYVACVKGSHVYRSEEVGPTKGNLVHVKGFRGEFFKKMILFLANFIKIFK